MSKKAVEVTKWLKLRGKKVSEAAENLGFKSDNGFRDAINNGTLTPIRTVELAKLLGTPITELISFLTDGALEGADFSQVRVPYMKSLSKASDPYDLLARIYDQKEDLEAMLVEFRAARNKKS
jgi:hypothetical protein